MILKIFAIQDVRSEQYGTPMFLSTTGQVIRSIADEVNTNKESMLNKHPEDFILFELGEYDIQTGEIKAHTPTQVALLKDLKTA